MFYFLKTDVCFKIAFFFKISFFIQNRVFFLQNHHFLFQNRVFYFKIEFLFEELEIVLKISFFSLKSRFCLQTAMLKKTRFCFKKQGYLTTGHIFIPVA